jgi:hypothetical protein
MTTREITLRCAAAMQTRKTNTDYTRDRRARLLTSGWCVDCAMNHNAAGHILCKHCLRARANMAQRRRNALKAAVLECDPPLTEKERTA